MPWVSPSVYCSDNPVNKIDPDGRREWPVNRTYNGNGHRHENNLHASRPHGRSHQGVDVNHTGGSNTDKGAPIVATHNGIVARVGHAGDGDGNRVKITSIDGAVSTSYMHLGAISSGLKVGSETLYYNESSNGSFPCYNGNISAMNWKVQSDTQRGYNFHYDDLSRIAAADYQNNDANTDKNYSTTYAYDNMGNIKSLARYGLSAKPSTFGMINNLTLNYNGNQLSSVTDASSSEPSYTGAFNFVKASVGTPEYTYDANGNLIRDSNKKIAKIQYNILNLPSALQFTEGHTSEYLYDAAEVKRKVKQVTTTENLLVPMGSMLPVPADKVAVTTQTDYCGNVIYENGVLSRILFDDGYIMMSGATPTYQEN